MAKRSTLWSFILYPDSMPVNAFDILSDLHTNIVVSPLHDKDINPDGEPKKPHYHVLLTFDTLKSYSQVTSITDSLNATVPQICQNKKGMVRYFIHMDNPEKYPYNRSDIRVFGYEDLDEYFTLSFTDRNALLSDIFQYINDNNIFEFKVFIDYCIKFRRNDWLPLMTSTNITYLVCSYIRSFKFMSRE